MREIRQSGSEGGVAHTRHPYPYMRGWCVLVVYGLVPVTFDGFDARG